jgi:glycerol-3-phosphate dehydrogenase
VLGAVNDLFPEAQLTPGDVVSSWAGLRPLIASASGQPSDLSRSHRIEQVEPGWWDVAGGKLTTYRLMAEQTVDQVVGELGRCFNPCRTADTPLLPTEETQGVSQITPPLFCHKMVEHFCSKEWAIHLDDVMMRRSSWHFYHVDAAGLARQTAAWMAAQLGWNVEEQEKQWRRYLDAVDWPVRKSVA